MKNTVTRYRIEMDVVIGTTGMSERDVEIALERMLKGYSSNNRIKHDMILECEMAIQSSKEETDSTDNVVQMDDYRKGE